MVQYDETEVLYVVTEEFAKIVIELGGVLYPALSSAQKAKFDDLNVRLTKLGKVSSQYVIPPKRLAALRAKLQALLAAA